MKKIRIVEDIPKKKYKKGGGHTLENKSNKGFRALCILGSICLCMITFMGIRSRFVPSTPKTQVTKNKAVSVYVDDGEGNYRPNEDGTFPTEGYVLNTEKSGCANGGMLSQNPETKTISLSVSGSDQCHVYFDKEKKVNEFANMLIAKANDSSMTNYNSGNKGEMFTFKHPATAQTGELTDYRYIGATPNNYIEFNNEVWRIIGVFTVDVEDGSKEELVKIIRQGSIQSGQWNSTTINDKYINEWKDGSLQVLLNSGDYYNRQGSYASTGLTTNAQSQIAKVKYYLGGSTVSENLGGPDYYSFERGTTTCATNGECVGQTRSTSVYQSIGLMYPSDYVYTYANGVDNKCYNDSYNCHADEGGSPSNGWLFNTISPSNTYWTQSPGASNLTLAEMPGSPSLHVIFNIKSGRVQTTATGYIFNGNEVKVQQNIVPVVYLNSDLQITGTGSQDDPYKIK